MPRKKAAPKDTSKEKTAPETVEMVKFKVTADVAEVGQMELYRGWRGPLPMDKAQTLEKLGKGKIIGV